MESTSTPGADPAQTPGPGTPPADTPPETTEDPGARTPEQDADLEANPATPGEQEQDPESGGGDPANQVQRTSPPPADWQSGEPNPPTASPDREVQTAGGSTDGLSVGTTADEGGEPDADPDES